MVAIPRIGGPLVSSRVAPRRQAPVRRAPARSPIALSLSQQANQAVNQQLAPQEAAQNSFNARQSQVVQQFANALLGKLQGVAPQVGADYDKAIQQTGALSGQAATFLQNANPSGQVAELLKGAGAPQAQQDQITGQLGQTFGGGAGVLAFTGGAIPGGELAAGKAALQGQAEQLPGFAALRGQQDLASALWQQGQDRQKLEATRPALYQQAAQNLTANQLAQQRLTQSAQAQRATAKYRQQTTAEKRREYGITQQGKAADRQLKQQATDFLNWYRTQGVHLKETQINQKAQEFGITAAQRDQQIGISQQNANTSAQRAAASQANAQSRLAQSGARLKLAQRHEKAYEASKAASTAAKRKGISPTSYANLRKQALKAADLYYYGDAKKQVSGINYGPAVKRLVDGYSLSKADAQAILNDFYAPGEAGRPAKPSQPLKARVKPTGPLGLQGVG